MNDAVATVVADKAVWGNSLHIGFSEPFGGGENSREQGELKVRRRLGEALANAGC